MRKNSGNALFMILIAIFLLGGVTALVVRTSGTSEETGSGEKLSLKVSEMLRYTAGMGQTIQKLVSSGCSENEINFQSSRWNATGHYGNLSGTDNPNCMVFDKQGGGYPFISVPSGLQTSSDGSFYTYNGAYHVVGVGSAAQGKANLAVVVPGLTKAACTEINRRLGVQNFAKPNAVVFTTFGGFFSDLGPSGPDVFGSGGTNPEYLVGKKAFCYETGAVQGVYSGGPGYIYSPAPPDNVVYVFYQILYTR